MMNIYTFRLSQLDRIRNRKERDEAEKFLKKQFAQWELEETATVEFTDTTLDQIITQQEAAMALVGWADKLGAFFKVTELTSSQLRNIFGEVRNIEQRGFADPAARHRFVLLIPKLKYAAARAKTDGMRGLCDVLTAGIKRVGDSDDNFRRFVDFFEAILAYHKAYGGN